ncbi:MAG: lysA [Dehalococcoidia bacterium]|nr:lysA [Dehalococcoidia bacterium]
MNASTLLQGSTIFPMTAAVNSAGHLTLGGVDVVELTAQYGTPLYIFDEETLRGQCRDFLGEFGRLYPKVRVIYACKAFINRALAVLLNQEGVGLDVVSGGEMSVAQSVEFPMEKVYFHGNNKGESELRAAIQGGVGRIVVDSMAELALLESLCAQMGMTQDIMLRITPGVDPHTHVHTTTGITDSKFGLSVATGQAEAAVAVAMAAPHLRPVGLHFHLGSPIYETEPYQVAMEIVVAFAADMKRKHGYPLEELSPGGGFAIQYVRDRPAPPVREYAEAIASALLSQCKIHGFEPPLLILEPGRSIVGRAGVAVYSVGAIKEIPGVRKYVSVDGGMADNIRPALYDAAYEALVANRALEEPSEVVTVAGKYCESGDLLIRDLSAPQLRSGDLLALPASGAYCLAMASNYNLALKPAVVMVSEGRSRLIRRRETYQDLLGLDLM